VQRIVSPEIRKIAPLTRQLLQITSRLLAVTQPITDLLQQTGAALAAIKQHTVTYYTVSHKNRTLVIFSNISNKSGPILMIFGTENRQ